MLETETFASLPPVWVTETLPLEVPENGISEPLSQITTKRILQLDRLHYYLNKTFFSKTSANFFIAGGYITKKLLNEVPNDVDLFFSSRKDIARLILDFRKNFNFKHTYIGKNLIRGTIEHNNKRFKVDIVKRLFASAKDTINNFDFTICCFGFDRDSYYYHLDAPFDLLLKKLNINTILYPAATMMRLQKYVKRDFTYCKGVVRQIMEEIKKEETTIAEQFFYEDGILSFNNMD